MAWRVSEELNAIRQRIEELLDVGWRSIRVVTDHGWLWMPGNLPKVDLPQHLTVSKWGRCARPDPQAAHEMQQVSWFWGNEHPVVLAPGISVFMNGVEYAHGGLTLQEALTLSLEITNPNRASGKTVAITDIKWVGLRLKVESAPANSSVKVDIRLKAADPDATIFKTEEAQKQLAKGPNDEGRMSLFIEDDSLLGQAAILVLLRDGQVIAKKTITIGED